MAFDKEILREIHSRLAARRQANENLASARAEQIYEQIPRIRDIDVELRLTPVEIVRAAFSRRENPETELQKVRNKNLKLQAERKECLTANGFPADYLEVQYNCKKCEDKGYINPGEPCECLLEEYRQEQVKKLRTSFGFEVRPFESFKLEYYSKERNGNPISPYENVQVNYNICKKYAEKFDENSGNIFITGGTGLGKTHLASCIALEVAAKGFSVVYGTSFEILGAFEDKKFNREVLGDKTEDYKKADLLIIDDLGAEMITQFSTAALYNLMATREAAGKSTIVITTLTLNEIASKYTPQIASRLDGNYVTVSLFGEDIRKKVGK